MEDEIAGEAHPTFPEDLFEACLQMCDAYSIGSSLVNLYGADTAMPDFVPTRLIPRFQKMVVEYIAQLD
jgi:hypothetical protein